jgi:hypothetical protein
MEILVIIGKVLLFICSAGLMLMLLWVAAVFLFEIPSHSEQSEEEERALLESLKSGQGLRASEMGENCD